MGTLDRAIETQLANIEAKTGKGRDALLAAILGCGKDRHGEMVAWTKASFGVGHGDANMLVHLARAPAAPADPGDPRDSIYVGPKAHQRTIHDRLMEAIAGFGPFEVAPKKGYVSLRRTRQFAMLGPKTNSRFSLGINLREQATHPLMKAEAPGGMCHYSFLLESPDDVDDMMIAIVRRAYAAAE